MAENKKLVDISFSMGSSLYPSITIMIGDAQNSKVEIKQFTKVADIGSDLILFQGKTSAIIPASRIVAVIPTPSA